MVIKFEDQAAVIPVGKPIAVPMPVAPVVLCVIGVNTAFKQTVGMVEGAETVLAVITVIVPIALTDPQPPVNGIV